jgi:glutaconate CoA-transferase subunit B
VVTNKAIFDFGSGGGMCLRSLHPGVALDDVLSHMSFEPTISENIPVTVQPSPEELRLLREVIDPRSVMMRV